MIEAPSKEVDSEVNRMLSTGIVDLDLPKESVAPGAIERIKSGIRIAAGRNLKSEVPTLLV